jgi:hypothetical protein
MSENKLKITPSLILGLAWKYREQLRDSRCGGNIGQGMLEWCLKQEGWTKDNKDVI